MPVKRLDTEAHRCDIKCVELHGVVTFMNVFPYTNDVLKNRVSFDDYTFTNHLECQRYKMFL